MLVPFYILIVTWIIVFILVLYTQKRKGKLKKLTVKQFTIACAVFIVSMILTIGFMNLMG